MNRKSIVTIVFLFITIAGSAQNFQKALEVFETNTNTYKKGADLILVQKKYAEGIAVLTELIDKYEKTQNYSPNFLAECYSTRGTGWLSLEQYQKAADDFNKAILLIDKAEVSFKGELSNNLCLLSIAYYKLENRQETMQAADKYVKTATDHYGEYHSQTIDALDLRSNYEGFYNLATSALQDRKHVFQIIKKNVERNFTYLTTTERNAYWNKYRPMTDLMFTFSHQLGVWQSSFTDELFNQQLLAKGLLLATESALKRSIENDPDLESTYLKIRKLRLKAMDAETPPSKAEAATLEADRLERSLGTSASSLYQYMDFIKTNYNDVKSKLKPDEVAIEFSDYRIGKDSIMYAALVLSPQWDHVRFLPLIEKRELEDDNTALFQRLWLPILDILPHGTRSIYFAPSGLLYQLPLESLSFDDGRLISEAFQLYRLSSTRWLAYQSPASTGTDAIVFGGLLYEMDTADMRADAQRYPKQRGETGLPLYLRGGSIGIPYLEGTKTEADSITLTINNAAKTGLHAEAILGKQGTEAAFKSLSGKHKRLIHLATHGFYRKDILANDNGDDALVKSGLYLAGASNKFKGKKLPQDIEDGILTSLEISSLDLSGLDLVVLSACETGQGKITSDGVFGLQRGFKKAGANSILMSLWKVNDSATCSLMTDFYKNWINEGMTKHQALEAAKQNVRSHVEIGWNDPVYWAAFILLDGLDNKTP